MDPYFPGDAREAAALQKALAGRVREAGPPRRLRRVAGVDVAYDNERRTAFAAAVVVSYAGGESLMTATAEGPLTFPYVPGLLSFREAPLCLRLLEPMRDEFDCLVVDGQGIAHPRRLGLASHLGLLLRKPTIGCAKSRLWGETRHPLASRRGAAVTLYDGDAVIGEVLRTRTGVKPVFVSVGHKARLDWARELLLTLAPRYRIPQPTRLAHLAVTAVKKRSGARPGGGRGD